MLELLAALVVPLTKLLEVAFINDYDAEAERQALLNLQRAMFEERLRRRLAQPR